MENDDEGRVRWMPRHVVHDLLRSLGLEAVDDSGCQPPAVQEHANRQDEEPPGGEQYQPAVAIYEGAERLEHAGRNMSRIERRLIPFRIAEDAGRARFLITRVARVTRYAPPAPPRRCTAAGRPSTRRAR